MPTAVSKKRGKSSPSPSKDVPAASNPLISDAKLKQLYSTMLQCRLLEERAHEMRAGKGKAAPFPGAEATIAGTLLDLRRDDWLLPLHNDLLARFVKGMPLASIFSELRQTDARRTPTTPKPAAPAHAKDHSPFHILPSAPNPAAQLNLASGVALALQAQKTGNIVVAFSGDTSDSGKRWQEALRFAGKHCLPLLVLVHTKAAAKTASAKKKQAFVSLLNELPVIPVDAGDLVAIYRVAYESIHKARHGGGPTLIHAISFPRPARSKASSREAPGAIGKMEAYLAAKGLFSSAWKQELIDGFARNLDIAFNSVRTLASRQSKSKKASRLGK